MLSHKILKDIENKKEPIYSICKNKDYRQAVYDIIYGPREICENPNCNNTVNFLSFSAGYRRFCCVKCSKNPTETKKINMFNGVNKIRSTPTTEKTLYYKKVREITRYTVQLNYEIINPNNYKLGRAGVKDAYQIDHIISVNYGFIHNIDPNIIGGIDNLQVVPWRVNAVKNKYCNVDIKNIDLNYEKIKYNKDLTISEFVEKYCLDSSNKINNRINKKWFHLRGLNEIYDEIIKVTDYMSYEKFTYKLFCVRYMMYKNKIKFPECNRANYTRLFYNPKSSWVKLTGNDYEDYKKYFFSYDKRLKKFRKISNSYDMKETSNKKGLLHIYFKYYVNNI